MDTPNKTDNMKLDTKWIITAIVMLIVVAGIGNLAICGNKHPDDATTLNNLALLYSTQGKYEEAEPLYKRSLGIKEKSLGADHPEVAINLVNLANLYRQQGKYEEAEPLYRRSLEIFRSTFPNGHPNIDACENDYARLKRAMQSEQRGQVFNLDN